MKCNETKKKLISYLDSELSKSKMSEVEKHLSECADCQKEKELLEKSWSMLNDIQTPEVSNNFTTNLMARIHIKNEKKSEFSFSAPKFHFHNGFKRLATAAVAACLLVIVYLIVNSYLSDSSYSIEKSSKQKLAVQRVKDTLIKVTDANNKTPVAEVVETIITGEINTENYNIEIVSTNIEIQKQNKLDKSNKTITDSIDKEIILNLEIYENISLYQNYALLDDYDAIKNSKEEAL